MVLTFILIGLVAGGLLGFIGTGAGLIIIPALMFFAHFSEKMAIGTSLTLLLPPIGFFAVLTYWKHGYVNLQAAGIIMVAFIIGSIITARIAVGMPDVVLERTFGIVAIAIGLKMLLSS